MATGRGHSDQTGREGQEQSVAGPVQRQGQELTGLWGVLATPGQTHKKIGSGDVLGCDGGAGDVCSGGKSLCR